MDVSPGKSGAARWAWIPLPLLLAVMLALWAADLRTSYEWPALNVGMKFLFTTVGSLAVAILMARSFEARPAPGLLLFGCGVLCWGLGSFAGPVIGRSNSNLVITIHNCNVWLASCACLAGVIAWRRMRRRLTPPGFWVVLGYACTLATVIGVAVVGSAGWLPPFFVQGEGGTLVRHFVLGSAILMFGTTALLLRPVSRGGTQPAFAHWFSLALLLLAAGLFGVTFQKVHGSLLGWVCRAAEYLGGAYMFIAALAAAHETGVPGISLGESSRAWHRYLMAVAVVITAAAARMMFLESIGLSVPFLTFFPAVTVAALYGGLGPGLLATALSALISDYFMIPPLGSLTIGEAGNVLALSIFVASSALISLVTEKMHRAQARAAAAEEQARYAVERRQAEQAMREREAQYRTLFENMTEEVHFWKVERDQQGHIVTWRLMDANPPALKTWGRTLEDVRGRTIEQIFGQGSLKRYLPLVGNMMAAGAPQSFEDYFPRLDRHYFITGVPLGDHFFTTGTDITTRKHSQEQLAESKRLLEALMDCVPEGITIAEGPEGRIQRVSRYGQELLGESYAGMTAEQVAARWHFYRTDGITPLEESERPVPRALKLGETVRDVEFIQVDSAGRALVISCNAAPLRDPKTGEITGAVVAWREITERKRMENAVRESEERFRAMADNIPQLAWMADAKGWIFWYNRRWHEYTGANLHQMQGWGWREVHHPEHLDRVERLWSSHLEHGDVWEDTFPLRRADGQYRWFLSRAVPIHDGEGRVVRWFGTNTDITEQKRVEEALRRSNEDLEQFAYVASHDLQEPLRTVIAYTELLLRKLPQPASPEIQQCAGFITDGGQRMIALVKGLLDYSRAARAAVIPSSPANMSQALHSACENLQASIDETGAAISAQGRLPQVFIEASQLTQIFQNLLSNSIKYCRPEVPLQVQVSAEWKNGEWLCRVTDNGRGFSPKYGEQIFRIFQRLHGRNVPGTGIGLSIVKTMVERHGGRIWAEAEDGAGATFCFTLPGLRPDRGPAAPLPDAPTQAGAAPTTPHDGP
jgi:PAS domain S-box-containing protein